MSILSDSIPNEVLENIARACEESARLRMLSNKDLVLEYIKLSTLGEDDELHGEELCTRVWPEWAGPLSLSERIEMRWMGFKRWLVEKLA